METPNNSIPRKIALIKLLVAQQNKPIKPSAAAKPGSNPKIPPKKQPKVAPIQKVGTISPPLKPAAKVITVKMIFKIKSYQYALPDIALIATSIPEPL